MEVHAPEHGIHSWRDFLVHMGTISLGLLLAIGLEQTVEVLHHRHTVAELRRGLREESEENRRNALADSHNVEAKIAAETKVMQGLSAYLNNGTPLPARDTPPAREDGDAPADPVWSAARASGWLAFVPEDLIQVYTEVDTGVVEWDKAGDRALAASTKLKAYETGLCGGPCLTLDPSKVSTAEVRQYLALTSEVVDAYRSRLFLDQFLYGVESAILRGETSMPAIHKAEREPVPPRGTK